MHTNCGVAGRAVVLLLATLVATPAQSGKIPPAKDPYAAARKASRSEPGGRYERGGGAASNVDAEIRKSCTAAEKGDANAQFDLGYLYAIGRGVRRDDALAAAWFLKAARQDHRQASNWLNLLRVKPKSRADCVLSGGRPMGNNRKPSAHPAQGAIANLVRSLAPEYRLDPNLVLAVVEVESNFNPAARSDKDAQGLMQLIPATAERFGVRDVWDAEQNLRGGMAYLSWLMDYFKGDIRLALAGYNAGEQAVQRHGGIPPYDETQDYVRRIAQRLNL